MSTPAVTPRTVGLERVPAPTPQPWRRGALLTAAHDGTRIAPDLAWLHGVHTWPAAAPSWRLAADHGDPDQHPNYNADTGNNPYGAQPFTIQTLTRCPRTNDLDELRERAELQARLATSQAIARELWTGTLTRAAPWNYAGDRAHTLANPQATGNTSPDSGPWVNPHLLAADDIGPADHPAEAVGAVEAATMARLPGGPAYIHVPPAWLLELTQFGIRPEGDLLRTPLGNIVVADPGYAAAITHDDAPLAVYGTGPVVAWAGDITVHTDPALIVDHDTNQVGVWTEQPALVLHDPQAAVGCGVTP